MYTNYLLDFYTSKLEHHLQANLFGLDETSSVTYNPGGTQTCTFTFLAIHSDEILASEWQEEPQYPNLVYTITVDSVAGALWLVRQAPNILCYLPPSNLGKNGVPVCVREKWRNCPTEFFCGVYYLNALVYTIKQLFTVSSVSAASGRHSCFDKSCPRKV